MANLQIFLNSLPIRAFDDVKALLEAAPYFLSVRTTQPQDKPQDDDDRYLLIITDQTPNEPAWLQECTGTIVSKKSHQIIACGLPKYKELTLDYTLSPTTSFLTPASKLWNEMHENGATGSTGPLLYTPYTEGVRLLFYWYEPTQRWEVSTSRVIDATRGFWYKNTPSWRTQFDQACEQIGFNNNCETLDKEYCHVLLLQTPWTPMVVTYQTYGLLHVAAIMRDSWTVNSSAVLYLKSSVGTVDKPIQWLPQLNWHVCDCAAAQGIANSLAYQPIPLSQQPLGYLVTDGRGYYAKVMNPQYAHVREVIGARPNMELRFVDIAIQPALEGEFLFHFAHFAQPLMQTKQRLNQLLLLVLQLYRNYFISKQRNQLPKGLFVTIQELHKGFLASDRKDKVSFDHVIKLIFGLKSEQILALLRDADNLNNQNNQAQCNVQKPMATAVGMDITNQIVD